MQKCLCKAALLMALAMSMSSCGPQLPDEVKEEAVEFDSASSSLHREFFDQLGVLRKNKPQELQEYTHFLDEVQGKANAFMKALSSCKEQADADDLYKAFPTDELKGMNDARRDTLLAAIQKSPAVVALSKYKDKAKNLHRKKGSINQAIQEFKDEHGEEADAEGVAEVNQQVAECDERLKSVDKALEGFANMFDGSVKDVDKYHDQAEQIIASVQTAYDNWTPPPPAPFHPEKVLFTVETTPAMYDSLLATLLQQYKNYTFLYTASNGDRCVTDAKNTEGVVIHLVDPAQFDRATDSLEQGRADLIFAFQATYPEEAYAKLEAKDAESEDELNTVLVSGVAHNALILKNSQAAALEKVSTKEIKSDLNATTVYTGTPESLAGELYAAILAPAGVEAQAVDHPERQGVSAENSLAAVAFSRKPTEAKEVRVAYTPSAEKIYFWPRPGDIAAGRYALSASVNAAFNPASQGNAEARKFVEFVLSEAGQSVVKSADFVSRDEYEENDPELLRLKAMFEKAGYSIGRIVTFDTFLFPKNDANIIKKPEVIDRRAEFKQFDSKVRSNFNHISQVLSKTTSDKGVIAVGIIGHASSEGGAAVNKPLSVNRAKYTGSCIKQKSGKMLILTDGMSSEVPVDDNKSEEGRVRNRRATAYVVEVYEVGTKK